MSTQYYKITLIVSYEFDNEVENEQDFKKDIRFLIDEFGTEEDDIELLDIKLLTINEDLLKEKDLLLDQQYYGAEIIISNDKDPELFFRGCIDIMDWFLKPFWFNHYKIDIPTHLVNV